MKKIITFAIAGLAGLSGASAALLHTAAAHHSSSMFDKSKTLVLTGTVVELRWTNPHVHLVLNGTTKPGEPPADWLIESTSPANLQRTGPWSRTAFKPGDRVRAEFSPLREGDAKG